MIAESVLVSEFEWFFTRAQSGLKYDNTGIGKSGQITKIDDEHVYFHHFGEPIEYSLDRPKSEE
jgi:hypothetical protein